MVSFDIKSLFTNVPVDEALEVILQRLTEDETLADRTALTPEQITHLLELCLKTTYRIAGYFRRSNISYIKFSIGSNFRHTHVV